MDRFAGSQPAACSSGKKGGRLRHRGRAHFGPHHFGGGGHVHCGQVFSGEGAKRPVVRGREIQQSCFIGLAFGADQSSHGFSGQPCPAEFCGDGPLHEAEAGVALAAHTNPEGGGMPAAGGLGFGSDTQFGIVRIGCCFDGCRWLAPRLGAAALHHPHGRTAGLFLHQLAPGLRAAAASPTPGFAECIQCETAFTGAGPCDDGAALQPLRQFPRPLLRSAAVAAQQGNHPASLGIEHQDGGVVLLALDQGGNQPGDGTHSPDQQQGLAGLPLVGEQLLDGWFGAAGLIDPAALLEAIKQGLAGGRQADAEAGHWQTGRRGGQSRCR